jgi:nicotinate-nucleotide pyrophosphorylase
VRAQFSPAAFRRRDANAALCRGRGRNAAQILDTRKTAPGLRALQKYAVRCGGGVNHRFGLYDRFLIKDNHLALMGDRQPLAEAIRAARALDPEALLEVEVDRLDQIPEIISLGVDVILLDNMSLDEMRACVALIAGRAKTEASGNMTLERVPEVAADRGRFYLRGRADPQRPGDRFQPGNPLRRPALKGIKTAI